MILEVSPDAPMIVRAGAATILYLHIAGGMVGIGAGAAALVAPKGGQAHYWAGTTFFISMLIMAAIGALVSPFLPTPDWVNVVAGCFTLYLVATAWATARRKSGVGLFERVACVCGALIALMGLTVGSIGLSLPNLTGSSPAAPALVFGFIALIATSGDYRLIRRGGIAGRQRVSRHLWRMCLALFIAVGSLFGGQPQVFPDWARESGLLNVPVLVTLAAMFFWMLRVRLARRWQGGRREIKISHSVPEGLER